MLVRIRFANCYMYLTVWDGKVTAVLLICGLGKAVKNTATLHWWGGTLILQSGSGYGPVANSCEEDNEHKDSNVCRSNIMSNNNIVIL